MEEISINELLQRVIEGKEPKEILIDGKIYKHNLINGIHDYIRVDEDCETHSLFDEYNSSGILDLLNVKIEVLDKPIIEELKELQYYEVKYSNNIEQESINSFIVSNRDKINEIIKWINNRRYYND